MDQCPSSYKLMCLVLVASSRCLTSAILPMESEMKRTFLLFDVGKREEEDDCCGVGTVLGGWAGEVEGAL